MKRLNKFLSILLICVMVLNMGITAYAAEGDPTFTMSVDKTQVNVGDKVTLTISLDKAIEDITQLTIKVKPTFNGGKLGDNVTLSSKSTRYDFADNTAKAVGNFAITKLDDEWTIPAGTVATVEFTANAAGTLAFEVKTCSVTETYYDDNGDYKGEGFKSINIPSGVLSVAVSEAPAPTGYSVYASADSTPTNNQPASISIYADNSDPEVSTYNAYDLTVTYDNTKLALVVDETTGKYDLGGAVASDNADVSVTGNRIHIAGVGENKDNATDPIVTLNFTMNTTGVAEVSIVEAKVDNKGQAIENNAVKAAVYGGEDATPGSALIKVPYEVNKPDWVEDAVDSVLPGDDYTFWYTDTDNYTYENLTATMGGQNADIIDNNDGTYTIKNVTGNIEITVDQVPNTYTVTIPDTNTATVTGELSATYGEEYTFTVDPADATVDVRYNADNTEVPVSAVAGEDGKYMIRGENITGHFTITATTTSVDPDTTTSITFQGIESTEIKGGLSHVAPNGRDYDFTLNIQENFAYTAKIGNDSVDLKTFPEGERDAEGELTFTIPAAKLTGTPITVNITKTSTVLDGLKVEVSNYIQLDGKMMFLVMAKAGEDGTAPLAYSSGSEKVDAMYWSDSYKFESEIETLGAKAPAGAYCWLVISEGGAADVQTVAMGAISVYTGDEVKEPIAYDFDVNQTNGEVDINDAQLTYDMYTAEYSRFEEVTMDKFLEADLNGDKKVWSDDAAAIINSILNPTTTQEPQQ